MNGYELTRAWFEFSCTNTDKVNSNHTAMYLYIVDFFNYNKWPESLGLPTDWTMSKLGFKSYKTYKKTLDELIAFNKIELVDRSRNNHTSNIIKIIEVVKNTKSSAKSMTMSTTNSNDNSVTNSREAYINIQTLKPKTLKLINDNASLVEQCIEEWISSHDIAGDEDFESIWVLYGRKGSKANSKKKWKQVKKTDIEKIKAHIPIYLKSVSDRQYVKDFENYIKAKHWESVVVETPSTASYQTEADRIRARTGIEDKQEISRIADSSRYGIPLN